MPTKVSPYGKKVKFRARVTSAGNKIQINIPKYYHDDVRNNGFVGKVVLVEVKEITDTTDEFPY